MYFFEDKIYQNLNFTKKLEVAIQEICSMD